MIIIYIALEQFIHAYQTMYNTQYYRTEYVQVYSSDVGGGGGGGGGWQALVAVISGLVYEVGVPGGADLPAVLARVAGVALHVLGLHVVLHPLPRGAPDPQCVEMLQTPPINERKCSYRGPNQLCSQFSRENRRKLYFSYKKGRDYQFKIPKNIAFYSKIYVKNVKYRKQVPIFFSNVY